MLTVYRKEQQKIAKGLLSFHHSRMGKDSLTGELTQYEENEALQLYLYTPPNESNIQGILGVEEAKETVILRDIALNPSYRGEGEGFAMLDELQSLLEQKRILGTVETSTYLAKWREHRTFS